MLLSWEPRSFSPLILVAEAHSGLVRFWEITSSGGCFADIPSAGSRFKTDKEDSTPALISSPNTCLGLAFAHSVRQSVGIWSLA